MTIAAENIQEYFSKLPPDRKAALEKIHGIFKKHIPEEFAEALSYGMPGFVIPHTLYPAGYHCKPEEPLPFVSYASQKNHISLYHSGIYAFPDLKEWFEQQYEKQVGRKPDMGKSCLRIANPKTIPWNLLSELAGKISAEEWIEHYDKTVKK